MSENNNHIIPTRFEQACLDIKPSEIVIIRGGWEEGENGVRNWKFVMGDNFGNVDVDEKYFSILHAWFETDRWFEGGQVVIQMVHEIFGKEYRIREFVEFKEFTSCL